MCGMFRLILVELMHFMYAFESIIMVSPSHRLVFFLNFFYISLITHFFNYSGFLILINNF